MSLSKVIAIACAASCAPMVAPEFRMPETTTEIACVSVGGMCCLAAIYALVARGIFRPRDTDTVVTQETEGYEKLQKDLSDLNMKFDAYVESKRNKWWWAKDLMMFGSGIGMMVIGASWRDTCNRRGWTEAAKWADEQGGLKCLFFLGLLVTVSGNSAFLTNLRAL